ncbi:SDR family NAD(P)-dependent oxidoreductase [Streptomyces sp. GQFP]|uniref:SDR family NAD(P)-dependent oxidoreductase n=1 Tax=Streptomyces sp. GQFP TaxID=2907545 RepID=UPI001F468535|nr:SDR family NAD(P)-dependent oxidoreductase [Streptomyces sp. GQFP]UIX29369.1 SDR family NAD(P)-dependent oxidoreductase [Streptomyces sp. GQFP]
MGQRPISLQDRVAVITGAGRGLGLAYAVEMAGRGAAIVVNDIDATCADEVVSTITEQGGIAIASYDDVSTPDGGAALVASALARFGKLDVVVNNAGILRNGFFEDLSLEEIEAVLRVNLASAFYVTQPAWRIMKDLRYGRVVMTSSSTGLFSHGGAANYAATKAGLYGLTKALAFEGQDFGVRVNAVLPWATTTIAAGNPVPGHVENWRRLCGPDVPPDDPRRSPELMAHLVAYLASDHCTTTGEAFSVCRGRYGRVFAGVADGWSAEDPSNVTAEQVEEHVDQIRDIGRHTVPMWVFDEVRTVVEPLVTHARG